MSRAKWGTKTTPMAKSAWISFGPRIAVMPSASTRVGNDRITSTARMMRSSTRPPTKPAARPSGRPTTRATATVNSPASSDTRLPWITRLKMSRPMSSVPNGCVHEGGARTVAKSVATGS